MTFIHFSV